MKILIIKFGALGDIILSQGAINAIIKKHGAENCTILTAPSFVELMKKIAPVKIITMDRRKTWALPYFGYKIKAMKFDAVYDLQTNSFTDILYWFSGIKLWNGRVSNVWQDQNIYRDELNTPKRLAAQLVYGNIHESPDPSVDYLVSKKDFKLPQRYGLLAVGCSQNRLEKRFPLEYYTKIAKSMIKQKIHPVVIGGKSESLLGAMLSHDTEATNLCNQTELHDIAQIARGATMAIGNDTGPMHIITMAGCPSYWLFSEFSDPIISCPFGAKFEILQFNQNNCDEIVLQVQKILANY